MTEESTSKTVSQPPKPAEDRSSDNETPIRQVSPLLGTTHSVNLQLRNRNSPEDISDVLGTNVFQGYVNTPLQTLDSIVVNQPKRFLPLAEEAKRLEEEIHIEKLNEQWAGVTVKNIPTHKIIPLVYFRVQKSVKNILGVCFCIRQYVIGNMYDML